jgi:hypothetical protein
MDTIGSVHDLTGPRIERAINWDIDAMYKFTVHIVTASVNTGDVYAGAYFRDNSSFVFLMTEIVDGSIYVITPGWNVGGGTAGNINSDGSTTIVLRSRTTSDYRYGNVTNGIPHREGVSSTSFIPTHFGIVGAADGPWNGYVDFDLPRLEAIG